MLSSLIVVAVALVCSSKMALAECPCKHYEFEETSMYCADICLLTIPECVPESTTSLTILTPSILLVNDNIRRLTNLETLKIGLYVYINMTKTFLDGLNNLSQFRIFLTALDYVDRDWFVHAPSIKVLMLDRNEIPSLAAETFRSLPLLESVSLKSNRLTTLPPNIFVGTNLKKLDLDDNPWHCDCELAKFMDWVRENEVTMKENAFCSYPEQFQGLNLIDLTPNIACIKN